MVRLGVATIVLVAGAAVVTGSLASDDDDGEVIAVAPADESASTTSGAPGHDLAESGPGAAPPTPAGTAGTTSPRGLPTSGVAAVDTTAPVQGTTVPAAAPVTTTTIEPTPGGRCIIESHPGTFTRGQVVAVPVRGVPNATMLISVSNDVVADQLTHLTVDSIGNAVYRLQTDQSSPPGVYRLLCSQAVNGSPVRDMTTWNLL